MRRALHAARSLALDINVLMLVAVAGAMVLGEWGEGATVVFLFALAQLLEARAMERARGAIRALMDLTPAEALVRDAASGAFRRVPVDAIAVGDIVVVKPGEKIPLDGRVAAGESHVNQAPVTGESLPAEKRIGDEVFAGTINGRGALDVRVTRLRGDSTLARIIDMVERAQAQRAPSQTFVERFARIYTPVVLVLALRDRASCRRLLLGGELGRLDLSRAGAPRHLLPVRARDLDAGLGRVGARGRGAQGRADQGGRAPRAARRRALRRVRQDRHLDERGPPRRRRHVAERRGARAHPAAGRVARERGRSIRSARPSSRARASRASRLSSVEQFQALPGLGAEALVDGTRVVIGNHRLFEERGVCSPRRPRAIEAATLAAGGQTMVIVGAERSPSGSSACRIGRANRRARRCGCCASTASRTSRC